MVATMLILELGIMLVGIVTIFVKNAPIRGSVCWWRFVLEETQAFVLEETQALMGATRDASPPLELASCA